jgi:hypothetical protein
VLPLGCETKLGFIVEEQILIKLPILLWAEGTFERASTLERAVIEMEVIDVRNGSWRASDSDGVQLNIVIETITRAGWLIPATERVLIEESKVVDDLRDSLKEMRAGGAELDSYSLGELLPLVPELR